MKTIIKILLVILITSSLFIHAQTIWEHTGGPNGGLVSDVTINSKGWLYAGGWWGGAGLYRSKDNGKTWVRCDEKYGEFQVFTIAINSKDEIFVGNDWEGLLRSTDDGQTWDTLRYKYPLNECWAIAFDKTGNIYAGDGDWSGIVKSTDNGETWTNWVNLQTISLAVGPDNYIYAGTWGGVYRSTDEGVSWEKMADGLPDLAISCIEFDSAGTMYIGTGTGHNKGNGIYSSTNHGETWTHLALKDTVVQSLLIQGSKFIAGTLEYGVLVSTNSGKNWAASNNGLTNKNVFRLKMNSDKELFTASDSEGGIHKSTNGGISWKLTGLPGANVNSVAINNKTKTLYTASYNGVHKYDLINNEWTNLGFVDVTALGLKNDSILFAGTWMSGVFRSFDEGKNWEQIIQDSSFITHNIFITENGAILLATSDYLRVSYDNGTTWNRCSEGLTYWCEAIDTDISGNILVSGGGKVFRSTNRGESFSQIGSGFSLMPTNGLAINNNNVIFAGSNEGSQGGIFRSADNGSTWSKVYDKPSSVVFISKDQTIFTSRYKNGVIKSVDEGLTWTYDSAGFNTRFPVTVFKEDENHVIYAGTEAGLYKTKMPYTGITAEAQPPFKFCLSQNYPNPFNPTTRIEYSIETNSRVRLKIYDIIGKEVLTIVNRDHTPGKYSVDFDGGSLGSGVYIYSLSAGDKIASGKMALIK